jgi:hypothetical protein
VAIRSNPSNYYIAPELSPYLCPVDILYSEALGWGLTRTMTLAEGAEKCDFRFKQGGATKVAVPDAMQHIIARKRKNSRERGHSHSCFPADRQFLINFPFIP